MSTNPHKRPHASSMPYSAHKKPRARAVRPSLSSSTSSSSSSSSSSSMPGLTGNFTDIDDLPVGIHVIYNPHAISTYEHTHEYIPTKFLGESVKVHHPKKKYKYKGYDREELWKMATETMTNTEHTIKDEDGEEIEVDTCYPAIDAADFFDHDKVDSTTNIIFLYIKKIDDETKMKGFLLCRDLHHKTLEEMRTKLIDEYGDNGDFAEYMTFQEEPCLYIEGLCAKERGIGRMLMQLVEKIADQSEEYKAVKLAALSYVVKYYYKLGYRFANSPNELFEKNIQDETIFQQINQDVKNLPLIQTDHETFKNKEWVDFINRIQHHKLLNTDYDNHITSKQKKRMKRGMTFYDAGEDKFIPRSPSKRVQYATESHNLGGDGWYMYKILNKETKTKAGAEVKVPRKKGRKSKKSKKSKKSRKKKSKSHSRKRTTHKKRNKRIRRKKVTFKTKK